MEEQIKALLEQNRQLLQTLSEKKSSSEKVSVNFQKFEEETEDFDTFFERFQSYLDVQKVPEELRAKVLITSLSPKLYKLLKNLLAPDIPSDQPLCKLQEVLQKHLNPKPLIIPSRHKFLNRKQMEGESINSFMAELRALAINCNYDSIMLNIMLRDVFVSGLRDKHILDRLFEEDNIDIEKTVQIALAMEKAVKGASDIMGQGINTVYANKRNRDIRNQNKKHFDKKKEFCSRCTGSDHHKGNCRFINSKCDFCAKIGHIKKACFAAKRENAKPVKQKQVKVSRTVEDKKIIPVLKLHCNETLCEVEPKQPPIMIKVKIEDKSCSMELDTGGTVSIMSLENFRRISNKKIQPTDLMFRTYNGDKLKPMGYVTVKVEYKKQNLKLNLYIVKENLDTLLGREWLSKLNLDWNSINSVRTVGGNKNLNKLLEEFKDIFDDKLGEINNYEVKLELKQGVKPVFRRFRTVPFALKDRIEKEIDRLEQEGIIEKTECSEWATPVVPVVKPDGSIRLCADFSVTLNPNLNVPQHPLPRLEEIFSSLNGGRQFSKLDFKHAYMQMKVHPDSQKLLTINTHKGLFICKRLMYGLNGAPAIWQRYVDGLFQGTEGVKVFMDDARITGVDENSHFLALETFFKKM